MVSSQEFNVWLGLWLLGLGLVAWGQRRSDSGVGLSLAYGLQLFVIHFLASAIYALPSYMAPSPMLLDGLKQSVYAIIAFGVGVSIIGPFLIVRTRRPEPRREVVLADPWLVHSYLILGVGAYVVQPLLRGIPTVGALVSVTSNLLLVALVMECWNGLSGPTHSLWRWIALSAILPFVTIVTQGFLGYGFSAMLTVFAFAATIYRPRWRVAAFAIIVSYFAMSLYVTYMRDRTMIREVVWGQESYSARMARMTDTFGRFEFLDLENYDHLSRIDDRLNQNALVGAAVGYLNLRPEEFAHGETIRDALLSPIPRVLWPNKPIAAGSGDLVSRFTGIRFAENTSIGIGNVLEWYINFGTVGVILGSLFLGIVIALIDAFCFAHLRAGNWANFALWYLPALSLLQVGGSLVEAVSGAGAGLAMGLLIHWFRPAHLRAGSRQREDGRDPYDVALSGQSYR